EGANRADQLLISEGRILAVADQGQYIRVLDLNTGKEIPRQSGLGTGVTQPNANTWMRVVGERLYAVSRRTVKNFNLDHPEQNGSMDIDPPGNPAIVDAFVGKRHLVLADYIA